MTPEMLDSWKILPRLMMLAVTVMCFQVTQWYMSLPSPSIEQSGFCSVVFGCLSASFAIWMGGEKK